MMEFEDDDLSEEEMAAHEREYRRLKNPYFDRNGNLLIAGDMVKASVSPFIFRTWGRANSTFAYQDDEGFYQIPKTDMDKKRPIMGKLLGLADQDQRAGEWLVGLLNEQTVFIATNNVAETNTLYLEAKLLERVDNSLLD